MDAANVTAVTQKNMPIAIYFAELDFSGGFVRVHTALGTITWGGNDWLGVGTLGTVSTVEESAELSNKTLTYTLTGVPNDMIAIVLGQNYQGRSAKLYIGFFDPDTGALVADPELLSTGQMNVSGIDEGTECGVTVTADNRFAAWDRPLVRRLTDTDQQARFPGDKGLQFIDQAAQKTINWGRKSE